MPIDYKKYPRDWRSKIVPEILLRANNKCEVCGLENYDNVYAVKLYVRCVGRYSWRTIWFRCKADTDRTAHQLGANVQYKRVILTVAHLDHDAENNNIDYGRLKAMCQICHLHYDAKMKYQKKVLDK